MDDLFPESLIRRFAAGEYIFREGDAGRHMYAVRSGCVEFRKAVAGGEPRLLQRIGPGAVFGEVALVEDVPRSADAIAVEATELAEIDHSHFVYLVGQQPAFAIMVMQMLSQRLRGGERDWQQRPSVGAGAGAGPTSRPSEWKKLRENVWHLAGEPGGAGCKVYLVRGTRRNVLIDSGLPSDYPFLVSHLASLGLAPEDIHMILLTHEHMDHVGSTAHFPASTLVAAHSRAANKIEMLDDFVIHGMATSRRLAQETRALFDTMSHGNSFSHILRGTASYAARGLKARLAKPQPKAPDVLPSDKSGTQGVSAP